MLSEKEASAISQNDVNKLLKNKEETEKLPNMFAAYQDTAQMAMNEHKLVSNGILP